MYSRSGPRWRRTSAGTGGLERPGRPCGACRYPEVDVRLRKRVAQARRLLGEVGVAAERVGLVEGAAGDVEATAIGEMAERIGSLA